MRKYTKMGLNRYVVVIFRGDYSPKITGIYGATTLKEAKLIVKDLLSARKGKNAFIVKAERWYVRTKTRAYTAK